MVFTATNATLQTAVNGWCDGSITASTPLDGGTYGALGAWDVSNVTDISNLFYTNSNRTFNDDIGNWDTSSVTDFRFVFRLTTKFNQDISGWDVSSGTEFDGMFKGSVFTQDLDWTFSTTQDIKLTGMFQDSPFNGNITNWNTSSVIKMDYMFNNAVFFNQNIGLWNTSSVIKMDYMFNNATAFNQPIRGWTTDPNVTNMEWMFYSADAMTPVYSSTTGYDSTSIGPTHAFFNQTFQPTQQSPQVELQSAVNEWCEGTTPGTSYNGVHINLWDTSLITNMQEIFRYKGEFNDDISGWDVSNVTSMYDMFVHSYVFNQDISGWDVSKVKTMQSMFSYAQDFNQDISGWDVSSVTNMEDAFNNARALNIPIHKWGIQPSDILTDMFIGAIALHTAYSGTTGFADTPTYDFFSKTPITQSNIQTAVNAWVTDPTTAEATYGNIKNWDVSAVTNMKNLFYNKKLFNDDISGWDVSNVTDMENMFHSAYVFNQPIGNWDVSKVTSMYDMFHSAIAFNQPLANWERTTGVNGATSTSTLSNVSTMGYF